MSMSLRDQLLKAGLVSQKQVKEAERQQERQARQAPREKRARGPASQGPRAPEGQQARQAAQAPRVSTPAPRPADRQLSEKLARDYALNRHHREKAEKKALLAQIRQLVEQNRLPPVEGNEYFNFVDAGKIRRIGVNASLRASLERGEILIVRHGGGYDFVPAAIAARVRQRDASAVIAPAPAESSAEDDAYKDFAVPDDLMW